MNLDFFEKIGEAIEKTIKKEKQEIPENISKEEMDLAKKLNAVEEFTVDRLEGEIAVLENRDTRKMLNVEIKELPYNLKEGDILKKVNGKYFQDEELSKEVEKRIEKKMDNLWKE